MSASTSFDHKHTCTHIHTTHAHTIQPAVVGQREGDVRLAGFESSKLMGRLEMFDGEDWYGICNDGFGVRELAVACRQLGLGNGVRVYNLDFDADSKIYRDITGRTDPVIVRCAYKACLICTLHCNSK